MSGEAPTETKAEFGARLVRMLEEALGAGAVANPEGWRVAGVTVRACRGGDNRVEEDVDPVLRLELPERALQLAVMQRDASKSAYRRTARYDLLYVAEGQSTSQALYDRDRETIDRLCAWVESWDGPAPAEAAEAAKPAG